MQKVHNFYRNIDKSVDDETAIGEWLASIPGTTEVLDVRKNWRYRREEIDFVRRTPNHEKGYGICYEAKCCDRVRETGNFFLEIVQDVDTKSPGAFKISTANFWLYLDTDQGGPLFQFDLDPVRTWVRQRWREFLMSNGEMFPAYWEKDGYQGEARGLCVPWVRLKAANLLTIHRDWRDEILFDAGRLVQIVK
jgi:hypothetical protein